MANNRRTRRIAEAMKRVAMPLASAQLRALTQATLRCFDRDFATRIAADGMQQAVPGATPCATSCEQTVLLTWAEADLLVARHPDVVSALLPALDRHNELLRTLGALRAAQPLHDDSAQRAHAELRQRWHAQRVPCVFLETTSKRCRIEESRPLACRARATRVQREGHADRIEDGQALPREPCDDEGPEYRVAQRSLMTATSDALGGTVLVGLLPSLVPRVFRDQATGSQTVRV